MVTPFHQLLDSGLTVTWGTIAVGWQGPGNHPRLITPEELIAYALEHPACGNDDRVDELAAIPPVDTDAIGKLLWQLAQGMDIAAETLKWEIVLLHEVLAHLPSDPIDGLIALTEFWATFEYPEDCPHVIQGRGNHIAPDDYYTSKNYLQLIDAHKQWLTIHVANLT